MKTTSFLFSLSFLSLVFFSFAIPNANIISVYINGKTIPANTTLTYEQSGTDMILSAHMPSGARFNELKFTLPSTNVGNYLVTADSKAKIAYNTTHGAHFYSQNQSATKGFIKIISNTNNTLQIEFECILSDGKQKTTLKTGKLQLNY